MRLFYRVLFLISVLVALWFALKSVVGAWGYLRLQGQAPAVIEGWEIEEISPSQFGYRVKYCFEAQGKRVKGEEVLKSPLYPNRYAAEGSLKSWKERRWTVYYVLLNPLTNTLQRPFPWKSLLYALISIGVLFYFIFLYQRAEQMKK